MRLLASLLALFAALLAIAAALAADEPAPAAGFSLDLALPEAVLDLGSSLSPREAGGATGWFTLAVRNSTALPVVRILEAADSPSAGISLMPPATRQALVEATSSDSAIAVERAEALGANAFRVTVPASGAVTLALRFQGVEARPILLAWMEPALIRHGRQAAVLSSVATGLLAAGFALALGAAFLSGTHFARWGAAFLAAILFAQLTASAAFDNSALAAWSGPHGLFAFCAAVALAAGIRLLDCIAPFDTFRPGLSLWRNHAALGILALGALAYAGVPFLGLVIRVLVVLGATAAAAYLVHCGRAGNIGARRLAPAATIFGLVTAAAACNALGLFGVNLIASGAIGGFSAAGALLVAIATAVPLEPLGTLLRPYASKSEDEQRHEIAAVTASHQGVFDLDLHSGLVSLSTEAAQLLDLPPGTVEVSPDNWLSRLHPDDRGVFREALDTYRHDPGIAFRIEFRTRGQGGRMAWFELRATMTGQATEAERCLGLIADVTARKNAEVTPSPSDPLTGLGTRAALLSMLEAMRGEMKLAALAVFDLDRFKSVNESLGRDGGDALLIALAGRLAEGLADNKDGENISLFRVGGDMFAASTKNFADPTAFGERLVDMLSPPFTIEGRDIYLPSSVGVAAGEHAADAQDLFAQAELAMVEAKREGGGHVVVHSSALRRAAPRDSVALETDLRRALEREEIEIHYQPIVRLKDGAVAGFEALARWRHPERGLIEPDAFVPQAERSGLIVPLGKFALRRAAEDLARWQKSFPSQPPLFVSVNVAWRQIRDKSFAKDLTSLLHGSGLAKHSFRLEVTEGQLMAAGSDLAETALKRLKGLGAGLSIDDFGTGHSSLGRLASFPFDTVKIDKSFLAASAGTNGAKILAAMVSLARELNMSVVCEGVETVAEAARLKQMGCEFGQGFLLGPPMPASEINAVIGKARGR